MANQLSLTAPNDAAEAQKNKVSQQIKALQGMPSSPAINTATSSLQLRQALGAAQREAGAGEVGMAQAIKAGEALKAKMGEQAVSAEQGRQEKQAQLSSLQLQQQGMESNQRLFNQETLLNRDITNQQMRFAAMSRDLAKELHDDTVKFQHDDLGRTLWNDKQLFDYAAIQAKSQEELENYAQVQSQMIERKQQMLKQANAVIAQALGQLVQQELTTATTAQSAEMQAKSQELQRYLAQKQQELAEKQADAARKAAKSAGMSGLINAAGSALILGSTVATGGVAGGLLAAGAAITGGNALYQFNK